VLRRVAVVLTAVVGALAIAGCGSGGSSSTLSKDEYESFVADPLTGLAAVCAFVGVEPEQGYLDACASIIRPRPDRSRERVDWTRPWIDEVERRLAGYDFLEGYAYED